MESSTLARIQNISNHILSCNNVSSNEGEDNIVTISNTTATGTQKKNKSKYDDVIESDASHVRDSQFEEELDISAELNSTTNEYEIKTIPYTLSFDQGFFHAIKAIELLAEKDPNKVIVVGIAGPVGAGKSTLAQKIAGLVNAIVIPLQDFIKLEAVKDNNYDDPVIIDFGKVIETINQLKQGQVVNIPKLVNKNIETKTAQLTSSKVIIVEGLYALSNTIRPLLNISIAITGGVHLDLIKRIMRDIVVSKSSTKDVLLQITNVVFPMFKAFVEPDLEQAKIKIHSSYNPMSQVVEPTYVCKAKYETHKENFDQFLSSLNVKPEKKAFSDMYLYPPKQGSDGISQADKTNWIRIRRIDGKFHIYIYKEIMDGAINTRPSLNFEISVKTIGGLLSLGYQIGAILNRHVEVWYEKSGIIITKEYIKELEKYFIQVKGQNRREVLGFAEKLKITGNHVPQTFLYLYFKKLKKNKAKSLATDQPNTIIKSSSSSAKIKKSTTK
ncbi:adenylate cyclase domain-containing protein [Tieghemostelium lacteum]|uniref:Adenylate cyclase domain-containing protein n=1 Tax=Tieghemostelium lacteum TaxID=361077 RepID=A0A152A3H4_TIELA|nr:adenylate cyclase domain-containing protein [Tieghemostelium lacteum]|eukprot:KYR00647.1 adenylate cyclase domain-containing protein [Tieghemostelium lacteum]